MRWCALPFAAVLLWSLPSAAQDGPGQDGRPADQLVHDLQLNLHRLGYYDGPPDGLHSDALLQALLAFERDEQVAPEAEPTPVLLQLSNAAISRIPSGGTCPDADAAAPGISVACGSIR